MKNKLIMEQDREPYDDYPNIIDEVERGERCGLAFTGEFEDGMPQFIGDNKAWDKYNKGNF